MVTKLLPWLQYHLCKRTIKTVQVERKICRCHLDTCEIHIKAFGQTQVTLLPPRLWDVGVIELMFVMHACMKYKTLHAS